MNPFYNSFYGDKRINSFGTQLKVKSQFGTFTQPQIQYKNDGVVEQMKKNVDMFISANIKNNNYDLFKNILSEKISGVASDTQSYDLQQISYYFPWVFSANVLFQPLRTILFTVSQGVKDDKQARQAASLPPALINKGAVQAVYDSINFKKPFIQIASQIFSQKHVGYINKVVNYLVQGMTIFLGYGLGALEKGAEYIEKILSGSWSLAKGIASYFQQLIGKAISFTASDTDLSADQIIMSETLKKGVTDSAFTKQFTSAQKMMQKIINNLFQNLKMYGGILINFSYAIACLEQKIIQGKSYYYDAKNPTIYLTCVQSYAKVYQIDQSGNLIQIPQNQFNIEFLRKLCKGRAVGDGAMLVRRMVQERTMTPKQMMGRKQFGKKYLQVKNVDLFRDSLINKAYENYYESKRGKTDSQALKAALQEATKIDSSSQQYVTWFNQPQ